MYCLDVDDSVTVSVSSVPLVLLKQKLNVAKSLSRCVCIRPYMYISIIIIYSVGVEFWLIRIYHMYKPDTVNDWNIIICMQ